MENSAFIRTYLGFGDCIFQFPFIKEACKHHKTVYLQTYFPFLFDSIPTIKFIKPTGAQSLKTNTKAISNYVDSFWVDKPDIIKQINFPYYLPQFKNGKNIIVSFNEGVPIKDYKIDNSLSIKSSWIEEAKKVLNSINTDKKICLIKPPSDRNDWKNKARLSKVEYFQYLIDKCKDDYYFISISNRNIDILGKELIGINKKFEWGELELTTIIALASLVDLIIAPNTFLFPLGLAVNIKTCIIGGGYTPSSFYTDFKRINTSKLILISPPNPCMCINRNHNCNKEISREILDNKIKEIIGDKIINDKPIQLLKKQKKNLLISRLDATRSSRIAINKWIRDYFDVYTIDHRPLSTYLSFGNRFKKSYIFPSVGSIIRPVVNKAKEEKIYTFCKDILERHRIDMVINAQPLHPYNTIMRTACNNLNIRVINYETFFNGKLILDYKSAQYDCPNEIYSYVDKIKVGEESNIDMVGKTRQPQPDTISKEIFFKKYNLPKNKNYIVLLGQLLWDMSVKKTVNPEIKNYKQYVDLILKSNPETTFIIKPHPIYLQHQHHPDMNFIKNYKNIVLVNESLETLFNIFNEFTSFSSSTILEGIIRNKKFATIGFHFCNNDDLIIQLRKNTNAENLFVQLKLLKINPEVRKKYLYFICNYYTVWSNSIKLFHRLTLSSKEYFSMKF